MASLVQIYVVFEKTSRHFSTVNTKYSWLHPIQWVSGALSPGVKQPGREADHSHPSSAEFKNAWRYTSTLQYVLCLVEHKDNFLQ